MDHHVSAVLHACPPSLTSGWDSGEPVQLSHVLASSALPLCSGRLRARVRVRVRVGVKVRLMVSLALWCLGVQFSTMSFGFLLNQQTSDLLHLHFWMVAPGNPKDKHPSSSALLLERFLDCSS